MQYPKKPNPLLVVSWVFARMGIGIQGVSIFKNSSIIFIPEI
jgi:hypothetical protein